MVFEYKVFNFNYIKQDIIASNYSPSYLLNLWDNEQRIFQRKSLQKNNKFDQGLQ
jgi:hypothetical protein